MGGSVEIDLYDYIEFADTSLSEEGQFTFTADAALPNGVTMDGSKVTWAPADEAEPVDVTFTVTDNTPYISLAGLDNDPASVTAKLTITFAVAPDMSSEFTPDESDANKTTYLISSKEDMEALAAYINGGNTAEGMTFKMTKDIDLEGSEDDQWMPIGGQSIHFNGTFDGGGYEVSGLYINSTSNFQGLFGYTGEQSVIRGVSVSGTVKGTYSVGGVVGRNDGIVENCRNSCVISNTANYVGGVVGFNGGTVRSSYNDGAVSGGAHVGGVTGYNYGSNSRVENCYNKGTVNGAVDVGGIAGANEGAIVNSYSVGTVSGSVYVGGISGYGSGEVMGSYYLEGTAEYDAVGGEMKTAEQFAQQSTFTDAGWDLTETWVMDEWFGRPVLQDPRELSGSGTESDPYVIPDLPTLERFRKTVEDGSTYAGQYVELTNDIDMSRFYGADIGGTEVSWTPIGSSSHPFNGTFNGGGYEISGLYINSSDNYQGLFGYLGTGGTICGLTVSGSVTGGNFVGGIAGGSVGSIFDCENKCDVSGSNIVGGVVGIVNGASTANAAVSGCVNSGSVESTAAYSSSIAGGIVGSADNEYVNIEECANYGRVGSTSSMPVSNVGGIVGTNYGTVAMSVNGQGAEIYGSVCAFGGIAGYNFHNILNCYNLGTLTATGIPGDATIGGIAGASYQAGYPGDTSNPPRIENCYSNTGSITAGAQEDSVFNSYYLSDTETEEANGMTGKTIAQFASGEVARLLQDGQTADDDGVKPQVWGQTLSGDTPDTYPVLTSDSARTLVKVSFMADDTEYAAAYTNPGGTVTLPQDPTSDEYEFVRWSQTQSTDGTAFTAQTAVNGDMTVYAVGEEMYGETGAEKKIETTYGTAATKDLSDYMTYAAGTDASEKFTYEITGGNNKTATANGNTVNASISGDTLSIPAGTNADTYTLTIRATAKKPVISMFAVDYDTEPVTFDVTVVVAKVSAGITMAPTANTLTYNGTAQALVKAGTAVGGTLIYSLAEDGEYSANIPTGTEADTYTVWYKVSADSNHNDTEPQSITVTISKAGSDSEVSGSETVVYGETLTLTAKVSRAQLTNGVLLYESQDEVEFFVGNTSLGTAKVEYDTMFDDEGTATLYVNTSEKQLAIGDNTIKAVYGGSVNLNGSESDTITVEMQQKPIEYTVMAEDKVYDGDTEVTVTLTPTNVIGDDDVSLTATGNTASSDAAVYERVDLTTITLSGDDMGYYSVSASANGVQLSEPVEISKAGSDSEVSGSETVVYGETLTLTAEVSRAQAGEVSLMAAQDEVEFFAGETSLGTADVVYDTMLSDEGTATLNVNTSEKQLAIGDNTIKAVYGGSVNLNGSESDTITVNMQPKPIEYTVTAEDKIYDGTNTVNVTLTPTNAIQGDDVTLTAEGTVETASTGEYTAIDLSNIAIGGEDSGYYSVSETAGDVTLAAPVSIKEAAETISIAIDYANETLTGFEAGRTYIINGEEATPEETTVGIDDQWFGTDVTIVKKAADEDHVDSETQTVSIPERPDAPDGISGSSSGRISGVDETMEYREDGDESWTAIDGSTVTGLSYGTYEVRIKATDSSFASEAETVTIRRRSGSSGGSSSTPATTTPTVSPTEAPTEEPTATEEPHETERPSENPSDGGYSDVSEDMWYSDTVDYVTENGLMNGTSETEFSPNADITRGMFVTVLYRMENSPETELDYSFTDVAADAYYAEAVAWADDNGIVTGYSDTEFAPEQTINREQMAAIIYRYADYKGEDTAVSGSVSYADAADISEYALTSVIWVSENRIMQGRTDNTFAPAEFTTRAEAAAVFERTHKRIVNEG